MSKSATSTVEHTSNGKFARAEITRSEDGSRHVNITFASKKTLRVSADEVNLRAMKSESLDEAMDKVCHATGRIALYRVDSFHGPKAMVRVFSASTKDGDTGYGLLLKRGKKALAFALTRVDLATMKAKSIAEAARKAAFTGRIALSGKAS